MGGIKIIEPENRTGSSTGENGQNGRPLTSPTDRQPSLSHAPTDAKNGQTANHTAANPPHHDLLDIPDIEVDTGETPIAADERAVIEAEAPMMAKPVEDISEDRAWLSHKLLNPRTIISFILAFGILIFIFTRLEIDPKATWNTITTANPLYLLTGFVVYYAAFWVRGARWKQLLRNVNIEEKQIPNVNGLVEIIYLSWFVNCIVPAKLGDAYRSYLLKRNAKISFSTTIGTILAERVIDLLVLFGLLSMSFLLVGQRLSNNQEFNLPLVMGLGAIMVLALIIGLVGLRFFGDLILRFVPLRFKDKFAAFQQGILRSFKRRSIPLLLVYTIAIWLMEAGRLFFVTRSLGAEEVTLSAVIFIALLSSLLTTLPLTPGGAGLVEGAVVLTLGLFIKNDHNLVVSIAILDRLINYWSLIAGGLILYLVSRRK
ncbi:MAG: lysylphosphatidylglycerol synthase transmembrane domain-containing protein [Chloroflexota bacterium]